MRKLGQNLGLTTSMVAVAIFAAVALGQQSTSDSGTLLRQAIDQYRQCDLLAAKNTFASIDASGLSDGDKIVLQGYMSSIDENITAQQSAAGAVQAAREAIDAGQYEVGIAKLAQAIGCELLSAQARTEAQTLLLVARQRQEESNIAAASSVDGEGNRVAGVVINAAPSLVVIGASSDEAPAEAAETLAAAPVETPAPTEQPASAPATAPAEPAATESAKPAEPAAPVVAETPTTAAPATESNVDEQRVKAAKELVALGRKELADGNKGEAVKYANRALQIYPGMALAKVLLDEASAQSLDASSGQQLLDQAGEMIRVRKQIADTNISKDMSDANNELSKAIAPSGRAENFDKAEALVKGAESTLLNSKNLFSPSEVSERQDKIELLKEQIQAKKTEKESAEVAQKRKEIESREAKRTKDLEVMRLNKVANLTVRARTLKQEEKYQEAKEIYEEIIKIDPSNQSAKEMVDTLEQFISRRLERNTNNRSMIEEASTYIEVREAAIPWYLMLKYDENWKQISARRDALNAGVYSDLEFDEDPVARHNAERKIKLKMQMPLKRPNFNGIPLSDVIDYLREASELNIYVDWPALQAAGVGKDRPVELNLVEVSFKTCLEKVLESVSSNSATTIPIRYYIQDSVITITNLTVQSQLEKYNRTYDIGDLIFKHEDFVGPRFDIEALTSGDGGGGGLFDTDAAAGANVIFDPAVEANRINGMIANALGNNAMSEGASIEVWNNKLVVTQTSENHAKILRLLKNLRELQAVQINVEARFVDINELTLNKIGVDLDVYFNVGSQISNVGHPVPPGAITVPGIGTTAYNGWDGQSADNWMTRNLRPIPFQSRTSSWTDSLGDLAIADSLSTGFTFLDDLQVNFFLQATQAHQDTRDLQAPRLTLWNGQEAYVSVTTQRAYVATVRPVSTGNTSAYEPVVEYAPTGVMMDVRATASADRKYVTMTVKPQLTNSDTSNSFAPVMASEIVPTIQVQLPEVRIREVCTTVSVPDSGTLLLGGQKNASDTEREQGVPVLSKIPVLNRGFTSRSQNRIMGTLLILVKPKIIIQQEFEQDQFP